MTRSSPRWTRQPLTAAERKAANLLTGDERRKFLEMLSIRRSQRKYRTRQREKKLAYTREWRKRAVARGYYRKGGAGARTWKNTPRAAAYQKWYRENVRKARRLLCSK